ncbi:hypothetical protein [Fusobacterium necrophorum]|jgi:hypothetical protein|uniref:hypothetical protein n=1 Tax=Fusobacterium necrophorum TaxID=859 RepID=UPI00241FE3F9
MLQTKFYRDSDFIYVKIINTKYKGNYIFIPRANTFVKIKYLEFKTYTYEIQDTKITEKDAIFQKLKHRLEEYKEEIESDNIKEEVLSGLPYYDWML